MSDPVDDLIAHLLDRLRLVQRHLGVESAEAGPETRFADALDSMGMVEFLALVAADCDVTPAEVEECAGRRFSSITELALAMRHAGILPRGVHHHGLAHLSETSPAPLDTSRTSWLAAVSLKLPRMIQYAASIDEALRRPIGWLESHAGIRERRIWADQDALVAAAQAGHECLERARLHVNDVDALLVTSEAPPLLIGLAAALHHKLGLRHTAVALEVGGACTGFLAALWVARALQTRMGIVLIVAVESPSAFLHIQPGPAGEAAALFGDAAAAALVCPDPTGTAPVPVIDITLGSAGEAADLLRVTYTKSGPVELQMQGTMLASWAIRAMADGVRGLARTHGISVSALAGVVSHGGNGRMPSLLARQLGLAPERVWSQTPALGNLGSASLPAAWATQQPTPRGLVAWAAAGAGLTWAAGLTGSL
jgi:3-oxoacyl-[acyl-carrier-protein] synthase-3